MKKSDPNLRIYPNYPNYSDHSHRSKGFTLIELLLYVSIVGTVIFSIAGFLSLSLQSRVKNQTLAEVEQQGIQVLQIFGQTARNATSITSPALGTSASSLTIVVPSSSLSPTVFDLATGAIRIKEGAAPPVALTNTRVTASNLTFSNLSRTGTSGTVRVSFTLTHLNPENRQEYNFSKTFYGTATLR